MKKHRKSELNLYIHWATSNVPGHFNPVCTDQFEPDLGGQVKSD